MALPVLEALDARIPQWDLERLTKRLCPFCESENEPVLIRPDQLPVAFCRTCGCWYVAKLPSASEIKKLYDGYYHSHRPADLSEKNVSRMLANARRASQTDWQLHTLSQLLGGMDNKRILDVGCGWGHFLLMAKALGAQVVGCDLSPEACEFARNRLGLTVHQSDLDSYSSAIGNIDAVVMRD
ncbi:MAG: class I SAM-dependent methyltransferase, partial [Desulfobacterales bacterium]|nr:class I SAM-dependent methyltransferase [Desulfobacterales bacterium]